MKIATNFLFAALVLALASAAGAAEAPATVAGESPAPVAQAAPGEVVVAPAGHCERAPGATLFSAGWKPAGAAASLVQMCGMCSNDPCKNVPRAQRCWKPGVSGGWGWCNIYSGGYLCEEGGWECQCGSGILP